jgi:hypothetical protein
MLVVDEICNGYNMRRLPTHGILPAVRFLLVPMLESFIPYSVL